eukprot:5619146-Prymnesium_polylepis.1
MVFSTADNSRPKQSASCPYGTVLSVDQICECIEGFEHDDTGEHCRRCPVGLDSRPATVNASGSAGCTMCDIGYYRPDALLPSSYCTSCGAIQGAECPSNATMETFVLSHGYWRHSARALETYRCKVGDGQWSPCKGGPAAGNGGEGYCEPGHTGAFCEMCLGNSTYDFYFDKLDARCHECGDITARAVAFAAVLLFC